MAKIENTRMTVSLDAESKRVFKNLTRAIDRLASRKWDETGGASGVKRLSEPAGDPALSDDNENHSLPPVVVYQETIESVREVNDSIFGLGKYNALR